MSLPICNNFFLEENTSILEDLILSISSHNIDYDLFSVLRYIDSMFCEKNIDIVKDNKINIKQNISLKFDFNNIDKIYFDKNLIYVHVNGVGLLSINSPLPRHFVEYIFERASQEGDKTWYDFINFLQNRSLILFYKAWNESHNYSALDNKNNNCFSRIISSFLGMNHILNDLHNQKYITINDKLYYTTFYLSNVKSRKNISKLLTHYFKTPINIEENVGYWYELRSDEKSFLGGIKNQLGDGVLLGSKIFDKQTKLRVVIGPISYLEYEKKLNIDVFFIKLQEWLDFLISAEFEWDCKVILLKDNIPCMKLDSNYSLGRNSWIGFSPKNVEFMV